MKVSFLDKLEALRIDWGNALSPTSARRCEFWNRLVGGKNHSQHLFGNACDFWFDDVLDLEKFIALAEKHDFGGIGHGVHKVHIDDRGYRSRWFYDDG